MKKFILIYDDLVYSFHTEKELTRYAEAYNIKDYTVALNYYEVENGETINSSKS